MPNKVGKSSFTHVIVGDELGLIKKLEKIPYPMRSPLQK